MKAANLTHSLAAKTAAIFLVTIILIVTVAAGLSIAAVTAAAGYEGTVEAAKKNVAVGFLYKYSHYLAEDYYYGSNMLSSYDDANFYYTIRDLDGNILASNYQNQDVLCIVNNRTSIGYSAAYDITLYCKNEMSRNDNLSLSMSWIDALFNFRYAGIFVCFIGIILSIVIIIFLCCSAGHRKGRDGIVLNKIDKIPFDLYNAFFIVIICIEVGILDSLWYGSDLQTLIATAVISIIDFLLFLGYTMSIAARIKAGVLIRNTLIYKIISFIFRCVKRIFTSLFNLIRNIPSIWKTALSVFVIALFNLLLALGTNNGGVFMLWVIEALIIVPYIMSSAVYLKKLEKAVQKIAEGNLSYHIDTRNMPWSLKKFAENLNSINIGMSKAVEERIKSERFKTELITNVSHDIKTPLTSIINYADLIKKENPENETVREYIEILAKQSSRMKKLIEDLVEASKAATGNLTVNFEPCEAGVLLEQTAGEYQEKLEREGLSLVINQPEDSVKIMADGRHLWRIFDNLMNNICKYAQPGTRVYLNLQRAEGKAAITFRNISKYPLNIPSEELMERFVRGDSSRNTEGSGLGLSIARSLTELQHGKLDLVVDGDLFKVILTFDTI